VVVNRTRDGGRTFETITRGLPQQHAYDLVFRHGLDVDDQGRTLAFGSTTGSLWVSEDGGDSWGAYLTERNELFDFIRDEKIEGVVCISGDSHMGELNCIPRSQDGGYDIYDFCSSPLAPVF